MEKKTYQIIVVLVSVALVGWLLTEWDKHSISSLAQGAPPIEKKDNYLEREILGLHKKLNRLSNQIAELKEMLKNCKTEEAPPPKMSHDYGSYDDRVIACQEEAKRRAKKGEDDLPKFRHPAGFVCSSCHLKNSRWYCSSEVTWPRP